MWSRSCDDALALRRGQYVQTIADLVITFDGFPVEMLDDNFGEFITALVKQMVNRFLYVLQLLAGQLSPQKCGGLEVNDTLIHCRHSLMFDFNIGIGVCVLAPFLQKMSWSEILRDFNQLVSKKILPHASQHIRMPWGHEV